MIPAFIFGAFVLLALGICSIIRHKRHVHKNNTTRSNSIQNTTHHYTTRYANFKDIECIRSLALDIWPRTYAETFSPQQVIYMLNKWFSEASLQKQMTSGHQYLLIIASNQPIGFASYSEVSPAVFKLHKIYILPAYQGLGAGKFTMEKIITELRDKQASTLTLNINQHNPAKAFYEQLGFTVAKTEFSAVGNGYYLNDFVMELKLLYQVNVPVSESALRPQ